MKTNDLVIIGSGPNGIKAALEFKVKFPHWDILLLDKGTALENINKYPNVRWHSSMEAIFLDSTINSSIPKIHNPTSKEVKHYFEYIIKENQLNIQEYTNVFLINKKSDYIEISYEKDNKKTTIQTKYALLATGIYENKKIPNFYKSQKNCFFTYDLNIKNKNLVLVGGGNSAHDFIINLLCKNKITWIIRSKKYKTVHNSLDEIFTKSIKNY